MTLKTQQLQLCYFT